jgi:hypothetical protein
MGILQTIETKQPALSLEFVKRQADLARPSKLVSKVSFPLSMVQFCALAAGVAISILGRDGAIRHLLSSLYRYKLVVCTLDKKNPLRQLAPTKPTQDVTNRQQPTFSHAAKGPPKHILMCITYIRPAKPRP